VETDHAARTIRSPRQLLVAWAPAAGAALALLGAVALRPDIGTALVVLGVCFVGAERLLPARRQPWRRPGIATDAVHFVVDEVLIAVLLIATVAVTFPILHLVVPHAVLDFAPDQSGAARAVEGLLLAEVLGYWGHRVCHEHACLWRFHELHHTIPMMDWLAPARRHPVDAAFERIVVLVPLAVLGFGYQIVFAHFALRRIQGLLVHANLRLNAGPLTWLIATPEFHHWHHADEPAAYNSNYAGQLPLVDWLFGTLYLPRPAWPTVYGCGKVAPEGYFAQLVEPFRRRPRPVSAGAEAVEVGVRTDPAPAEPDVVGAGVAA
jgi:sterol desaturase/sphingolipid hydroxylase (fatty acid hydroxylase superfamily)